MLLFREPMDRLILAGQKTQTRRVWRRRMVETGQLQPCYGRPPWQDGRPFAWVRILHVWQPKLLDISEREAAPEGFPSRADFLRFFRATLSAGTAEPQVVTAVEFELSHLAWPTPLVTENRLPWG